MQQETVHCVWKGVHFVEGKPASCGLKMHVLNKIV